MEQIFGSLRPKNWTARVLQFILVNPNSVKNNLASKNSYHKIKPPAIYYITLGKWLNCIPENPWPFESFSRRLINMDHWEKQSSNVEKLIGLGWIAALRCGPIGRHTLVENNNYSMCVRMYSAVEGRQARVFIYRPSQKQGPVSMIARSQPITINFGLLKRKELEEIKIIKFYFDK